MDNATDGSELRLRIKELMDEKGVSITRCCKDLDMDRESFLRYYRNNIQRMDRGILCRLMAYFDAGLLDILEYEKPEENDSKN